MTTFENRSLKARAIRLAALVTGAFAVAAAPAGAYSIGSPVRVSGPSPFAVCPFGASGGSVSYTNAEVEPFVAVNPTNPANVIGVFQQDRWSDGGSRGLVAGYSFDGGNTWGESFAGFDKCADESNPLERASDPWVTFDKAGNAYQISLSLSADLFSSAIEVSKSTDGGVSWDAPKTLIFDGPSDPGINDKGSITGDPTRDGYVYAVWDRNVQPSNGHRSPSSLGVTDAFVGRPMFSRTTDGGAHWSAPVSMFAKDSSVNTLGNQIVVAPDGSLVDVFLDFRGTGNQPPVSAGFYIDVMTSHDAGAHWSAPIHVATERGGAVNDPDTGQTIRTGAPTPDIAVDPRSGKLYVVWEENTLTGGAQADIALSSSTDGGQAWSAPVKVNQTPNAAAAFTPMVAVTGDGTVGVSYYDFRGNTAAPGVPTDLWLAHSHDGGASWTEQHVYGPFDEETAPDAAGLFLGDYEGLTAIGNDLLPFFVATNSGDTSNRTDVFAVRASTR